MAGVRAASQEEREAAGDALVEAVAKEIEPLLNNEGKGPFFGGSEKLTFAEVSFLPFDLYAGPLFCCLEIYADKRRSLPVHSYSESWLLRSRNIT